MAHIQKQFIAFHEAIQLTDLDENKTLREKRDLLLGKLRDGLAKKFEGGAVPTFSHRNQGSYSIGTGIKPTNGRDYDIDVALLFNIDPADYPDPLTVKGWVHDVLNVPPHKAEIRRPCVTVQYTEKGEDAYHVDFAVYAAPTDSRPTPVLAKGFPGSRADQKVWEPSDFVGLLDELSNRFDGDERLQYRRSIRYLKRWKDENFRAAGEAAPKGIGLTCAAYQWFQPHSSTDPVSKRRDDDDLGALKHLVDTMLNHFVDKGDGHGPRLRTPLPTAPHADPFERMSDKQMVAFMSKLEVLRERLWEAQDTADPSKACGLIAEALGSDFPVLSSKSVATAAASPAVVSTGHYA